MGGVDYPILFSGNSGVTIASAAGGAWGAVTLPSALPAMSNFEVVTHWHVAVAAS